MFKPKDKQDGSSSMKGILGSKKQKDSSSKIPSYFICPITLEMMEDPTITPCGHMFERDAIAKWLRDETKNSSCPLCHKKIEESALAPCYPIRAAIEEFKGKKSDEDKNVLASINKKIGGLKVFGNGKSDKEPEASASPPQQQAGSRKSSPPPASPKAKREDKKRDDMKKNGRSKTPWCKLVPLLHTYETLDIKSEEFTIGRSSHCDQIYNASEISNIHCMIYRVPRDATAGEYDCFVEDKSTNGTYINGNRVGKGLITSVVDGDEISLGERFSTKLIPKLHSFIEWVFAGIELTPDRKADVEKSKAIASFLDLVKHDEESLKRYGIRSEFVRSKLLTATKGWLDKYRFPAFKIEIAGKASSPLLPNSSMPASPSNGSFKDAQSQRVPVDNQSGAISEVGFEPSTYTERASTGVVVMYLKRTKNVKGQLVVLVKSTERGSAKVGQHYQPFEKKVTFADGVSDSNIEFYWKSDSITNGMTTVNFEIRVISGKAELDASEAMLIIEAPSKAKRESSPPVGQRVSQSIPQARSKTPTSPKSISSSSPPNAAALGYCIKSEDDFPSPDLNGRANNDELDDSERRQQVDDELLALMMDAFPNLDPHEIAKIIKQERQMIAPLEDRNLLQDLVAIKLTNLTRGNANELEYSNIKMMKAGDPEEKDGFSNSGMPSDPVGHIPFGKPAQNQRASQDPSSLAIQAHAMISSQPAMNADGTPKFRQTILRSELESFLLMASISLIRKFFTIQGIECNICHIPSTVVNISVSLTESFMRTLDSLAPIESSPITPAEDIFEFERIVELFKKYVYSNGSDLRSRAVGTDPKLLATGYKYDISFRKSAHHFKMENNHAIIEDLNSFARLQNIPQTSFYGVFDGHGGYLVSEYLSLHLAYNIAKLPIFAKNIPEAIRLGFKNTDELVLRKMQRDKIKGGSTAVIAILRENVLHVAWAGDARCVVFRRIGQNLVAFPIVNPHNPQGTEKARVVKAGGFVEFIAGKWRVNGRLAVTRSFGDDNLKPIVTAEPEMAKFPLNGDEQFLMLSCDGLYDVMDYSDVAECLDNYIRKGMKMGQLAAALVTEGVTRHSTDDITVMLVDLARNPDLY